jgi:predicted RNA-binding Zn ribbon-like protein
MSEPATIQTLKLLGGSPCLDFANTADWDGLQPLDDCLTNYRDLLQWSQRSLNLSESSAHQLEALATGEPQAAIAVFDRAIWLRSGIYRLLVAIADGQSHSPEDLQLLNQELALALPHLQIQSTPTGFVLDWMTTVALDSVLWAIAWSTAQLLSQPQQRDRLRVCPGERCGWLFLDTTRNRSRRWCDMQVCGNRAKAHRHYHKKTK